MNGKDFTRIANWGVTGYLQRHELQPSDLRITTVQREKVILFRFYHHGLLVHSCYSRKAMLKWMCESTREEALAAAAAEQQRLTAVVHEQEVIW